VTPAGGSATLTTSDHPRVEATSMSPDRNLLFGIVALQNDFVTRDQLIEAMNFW
jgi:hypothetical protein